MKLIDVQTITDDEFLVTINKNDVTFHRVFVSDVAQEKFAQGKLTKEQLLKKSFLFLLQKEDQALILEEFDIEDIEKYFPEFSNIAEIGWIDVSG